MAEWQLIDTAPRDRRILVLDDVGGVYIANWSAEATFERFEQKPGWQVFDCEDGFYSISLEENEVTHWMPLPKAPEAA